MPENRNRQIGKSENKFDWQNEFARKIIYANEPRMKIHLFEKRDTILI